MLTGPIADTWFSTSPDIPTNISWNKSVPLTLCMTAANIPGDLESIQYRWTNGFTLSPSNNYNISLSAVTYTLGSLSWLSFEPGMPIAVTLCLVNISR